MADVHQPPGPPQAALRVLLLPRRTEQRLQQILLHGEVCLHGIVLQEPLADGTGGLEARTAQQRVHHFALLRLAVDAHSEEVCFHLAEASHCFCRVDNLQRPLRLIAINRHRPMLSIEYIAWLRHTLLPSTALA